MFTHYLLLFKLKYINLAVDPLTNTTTRSTAGDARTPSTGGLGVLGLPEMERMFTGMPDTASLNQLLQNPAVSQMMQSILSNPQYMNQVSLELCFLKRGLDALECGSLQNLFF